MLAEQQKKSNIGVGVGFVLEVVGRLVIAQGAANGSTAAALLGGVVTLAGVALFIWGCVEYCRAKGQSPWFGLLGFLSCIGLIILIFLPDNDKGGAPPAQPGGFAGGSGVWPPPTA